MHQDECHYIHGQLIHLERCMAPVDVTTHPQCTNGKSQNVSSRNWKFSISDIKRRFVSKSISTCILGTVVVRKSMKYDGYTYSQVTTFMNNEMAENVVTQSTLHQLIGCTTRLNLVSHIALYPLYHIKMQACTKSNLDFFEIFEISQFRSKFSKNAEFGRKIGKSRFSYRNFRKSRFLS